jgi:membrane protein DedA with SNARE-associated domain/membrane-associated phospholipid phosphatase
MLSEFINNALPSIEHFRIAGYWIAFFSALLETTIGIGLIFPGSTIILLLGALSARGYLDVGDLIWFSILGAIIGDNVNFYLGKKYGSTFLEDGFWLLKAEYIGKAKSFMNTNGAKSVFFGRFIPSLKELIPLIAGSVNMNRRTFMVWNVLGAVGWGFEWVLAGYIFAKSLNLAALWLSRAGLFFAFLVILSVLFYCIKLLFLKNGQRFVSMVISIWHSIVGAIAENDHVLRWKQKYPRFISFLSMRFSPSEFSGLPLSILALAFVYVLVLFGGIVEDLITSDPIIAADVRISNLFHSLRSDALTEAFTWITLLGTSQIVLFFIFVSAVILWIWQKKSYIFPLLVAAAGSTVFTQLGKLAFRRPRPELAVYAEHSFSFPSGHATIAVAFYGFLAYLLIRFNPSWKRSVNICFITILVIIAIGLSRIYLGVHYLSDVWSGYLVGAMWLIIAIAFSEWSRRKESRDRMHSPVAGVRPISLSLVLTAVLFYVIISINYQYPLKAEPEQRHTLVSKSTDIFSDEQLKYTETLIGESQEPINYIFLAHSEDQLIDTILQSGWIMNKKAALGPFFKAIESWIRREPYPSAPISPSFWNAKIQEISFAKVPNINWLKDAQHIKIWRTHFILGNEKTIYVGMVNANDGFKWGIIPKINPDLDSERESFYTDLNKTGKIAAYRKTQLVKPLIGKNFLGDQFFTDGKAYIISLR